MSTDQRIGQMFHDLFGIAPDACNDATSMKTVEGWDSVNHLTLVFTLEETFNVQFSPEDISELTSVGRIKALLSQRGAA
jgi:acyl carrier protein